MHISGREWRFQSSHLVKYATGTPDVALSIIGQVLPDLGAGIVRCARLRLEHRALGYFRHVEVPKLDTVPVWGVHDKQIGALDVPVHDVIVMESFQSLDQLY